MRLGVQIWYRVSDLDRARDFYVSLLGFEELYRDDDGRWLRLGRDGVELHLAEGEGIGDPEGEAIVTLDVVDVKAEAERLREAGADAPRPEAERLAAFGLGCSWSDLWSRLDDAVETSGLDGLVSRRAAGEPFAYVVGTVVFAGLELEVGPGVLIPRPETETLVDVALELVPALDAVAVDIGTGAGPIALALASSRPAWDVHATDRSEAAIDYARRNALRHGIAVRFATGDLFAALPAALAGRIDLVCSNPPYVADGAVLPSDVGAEPPEALYAGPDGDDVLLRLVAGAPAWLRRGGALVLEVGTPAQARRIARAAGRWAGHGIRDDHTGRPRVVWARR